MTHEEYLKRITTDPRVEAGEPCIRDLPIRVSEIIGQLAGGMSIPQILAGHPELDRDDIMACVAFATQEEIGTYLY